MPEKYFDLITILLLTVLPLILLLLHMYLSARRAVIYSFLVPMLWTALGVWMIVASYEDFGFGTELFIFYLAGDLILLLESVFIRRKLRFKFK